MTPETEISQHPYVDLSIVSPTTLRYVELAAGLEPFRGNVDVTSLLPDDPWQRLDVRERQQAADTYADHAVRVLGKEALSRQIYVDTALRQIGAGMEVAHVTVKSGDTPGPEVVKLLWGAAVAIQAGSDQ